MSKIIHDVQSKIMFPVRTTVKLNRLFLWVSVLYTTSLHFVLPYQNSFIVLYSFFLVKCEIILSFGLQIYVQDLNTCQVALAIPISTLFLVFWSTR